MNVFAERMLMGFVLALLAAGVIGLAGINKKVLPLRECEVSQPSIGVLAVQEIKSIVSPD